jgi:hypothetical protein
VKNYVLNAGTVSGIPQLLKLKQKSRLVQNVETINLNTPRFSFVKDVRGIVLCYTRINTSNHHIRRRPTLLIAFPTHPMRS